MSCSSHGGILYYVVKIPRQGSAVSPVTKRRASSSSFLLENSLTTSISAPITPYQYRKFQYTDSGWENPFRPDGDLAKEADEIVGLIKEGKPIIAINQSQQFSSTDGAVVNADPIAKKDIQEQLASKTANSSDSKANGALIGDGVGAPVTGVEVEAGTVPVPADPSQVEHVVLKKKPKCKCCVIT